MIVLHENGAVVTAAGELLVRFVYADAALRAHLFAAVAKWAEPSGAFSWEDVIAWSKP